MKIKKAVIPAGGFGTRILPITKAMPKEMYPIVDKPAIQYIIEEAVESGIEDILIITNRGKYIIEDYIDDYYLANKEVWNGTSLTNTILGSCKTIDSISIKKLNDYKNTVFNKENVFMYLTGNINSVIDPDSL